MTLLTSLLFAANVTFSIYLPPHAATDGLRYRVAAEAGTDVPSALRACGIADFAVLGSDPTRPTYKFAVSRGEAAGAQCLRARLPNSASISPLDQWTTNAQTD